MEILLRKTKRKLGKKFYQRGDQYRRSLSGGVEIKIKRKKEKEKKKRLVERKKMRVSLGFQ